MNFLSAEIKKLISATLFIFFATFLFAEASDEVFSQIDQAFALQDQIRLSSILSAHEGDIDYAQYEDYVLKSVRQLIVENQLDFASEASLAVIDHNLENFEAVDLYSSIERSLKMEESELRRKRIETVWTR